MNKRSVTFLGLAAILSQLNLLGACASASDPQNGGGSGSSGTGSAGASSGASTGGSDATGSAGSGVSTAGSSAGGSTGTSGAAGAGGAPASADPSCMSNSTAKEGAMCTQDCMVECGYHGIGSKTCTCGGGIFTQCHCPKPAAYLGAATAGTCMTADGTTTLLSKQPCTTEWDECVGKDAVSGVTPQGCACMKDTTGTLTWVCGSTNQWFKLAL